MKNLTGPNIRLHFMSLSNVMNDTTHGPIHFPNLTVQVKTAASKTSAKPELVLTDNTLTLPPGALKTITAFLITHRIGIHQVL